MFAVLTALSMLARLILACSASNCGLPICPDCRECVQFCNCR